MKHLSIFLCCVCLLFVSCKPTVSLSGATIPIQAKTVSVGFFPNNTSLGAPSLSQRFTEKLRDVVSQQTNLKLIRQNGDLQFDGYLSEYNVAPIAIQSNDQASKNRMTISVSVKYFNKFEATKNFEQAFTRFADFDSNQNVASVEADLVDEIFKQITEDIYYKAFNNW